MKTIVVVDKFSVFRDIVPYVAALFPPDTDIVGCLASIHNLHGPRFTFPRGLSMRDYPHAKDPTYKPLIPYGSRSTLGWYTAENLDDTTDGSRWTTLQMIPNEDGEWLDPFEDADRIIVAMHSFPTSALTARMILDEALPKGHGDPRVTATILDMHDAAGLTSAFANAGKFDAVLGALAVQGAIRQRLNYNYAMNANVILRPIQHACGMAADAPPLSKYALQTLHAFADRRQAMSFVEAMDLMANWQGTGKYPGGLHAAGLGSIVSRDPILRSLVDAGLIEIVGTRARNVGGGVVEDDLYEIGVLGRKLLDHLHPDCRDPDLPFRIDAWSRLPEVEATSKVDRYIRTFFGKMGRYARRHEVGADALMLATA